MGGGKRAWPWLMQALTYSFIGEMADQGALITFKQLMAAIKAIA